MAIAKEIDELTSLYAHIKNSSKTRSYSQNTKTLFQKQLSRV